MLGRRLALLLGALLFLARLLGLATARTTTVLFVQLLQQRVETTRCLAPAGLPRHVDLRADAQALFKL